MAPEMIRLPAGASYSLSPSRPHYDLQQKSFYLPSLMYTVARPTSRSFYLNRAYGTTGLKTRNSSNYQAPSADAYKK
jgi:hypothetical protein